MQRLRKCMVVAVLCYLVSSPGLAAAHDAKDFFFDTLYGSITGGLIGAAVMVFTDNPTSHLAYIGYGLAGGAAVGAVYGSIHTARALAEVENGKVRFAIPAIIPDIEKSTSRGTPFVVKTQLLHGKF